MTAPVQSYTMQDECRITITVNHPPITPKIPPASPESTEVLLLVYTLLCTLIHINPTLTTSAAAFPSRFFAAT